MVQGLSAWLLGFLTTVLRDLVLAECDPETTMQTQVTTVSCRATMPQAGLGHWPVLCFRGTQNELPRGALSGATVCFLQPMVKHLA